MIHLAPTIFENSSVGGKLAEIAIKNNKDLFLKELLGFSPGLVGWKNTKNGNSLLHTAIIKKNYPAIRTILSAYENDQFTVNASGYNPLQLALNERLNHESIGAIASRFKNLLYLENSLITVKPLLYAVLNLDKQSVKALLDAGASPNASNYNGVCPEKMAKGLNKADVVDLLRQHKKTSVQKPSSQNTSVFTSFLGKNVRNVISAR